MPKTRIYFVRHCEAEGNFYRLFHGHYDSKITQNGKIQLGYLAERFKDISQDLWYDKCDISVPVYVYSRVSRNSCPRPTGPVLRGGLWVYIMTLRSMALEAEKYQILRY